MIKIKAITTEKGTVVPESIPSTTFGSHSDSEYFYFFESDKDKNDFYASLPVVPLVEMEENKVDLKSILMSATPEEIEFIKQLLK